MSASISHSLRRLPRPASDALPGDLSRAARWLLLTAVLASLLAGCDAHDRAARYRVAQRDFTWKGAPPAPGRAPLSLAWGFDAGAAAVGAWTPLAPTLGSMETRRGKPVLALSGQGQLLLVGPGSGRVDPEVHQWLSFRARTRTASRLTLSWRNSGESFSPDRSTTDLTLEATGDFVDYQIAMSSLRGIREAADAAEGVEEFRLRFRGDGADDELSVDIEQLALVSDYDVLSDRGVHVGRLERLGVARQGIALRLPGSATLDVSAGAGDRLRFALALVGAAQPAEVLVRERHGLLPEQRLRAQPGEGWVEHALELPEGALQFEFVAAGGQDARAVLLIGSVLRLQRTPEPRPPVVLYVEDTLRADHVSSLGYEHPTTPELSRIAAQGCSFTRAWATASWTRPSVSSILTSLDPVAHGNQLHTRRIPAALTTLPEALAGQGYLTASFITNYHAGAWSGLDQGFDVHSEPLAFGASDVTSTLTSDLIRDPIADFLARHADEQVFVFAHSLDPHAPYMPLAEDLRALLADPAPRTTSTAANRARFDESTLNYDAEVLHNDHALAALDATLQETGLAGRTLFVFVSDHGEAFAEHGQWEHRQSLHEEELRVPWIMRLPGTVAAGLHVDTPVSLTDLAPTLFGLLDLPAPAEWSGRDLSALCRTDATGGAGASAAAARPHPVFADVIYHELPRPGIRHEVAVVAWPFKLIATVDELGACTRTALFDLAADPAEQANLVQLPAYAEQAEGLLAVARERLARGPLHPAEGANAEGMDPALREWMVQLGYLR